MLVTKMEKLKEFLYSYKEMDLTRSNGWWEVEVETWREMSAMDKKVRITLGFKRSFIRYRWNQKLITQ